MPIPVVIAAGAVMGVKGLGMGGAAYVGYQGASYLYNGVRDWIDPSRVEKRQTELLVNLTKEKQEKESERMQHLNEVVQGIQQRREELNTGVVQQQTELQEIVQGVGTDSAAIQRQLDQIVPVSDGLEETARAQQELINRLQQELQRKQLAFEEAQRQLAESDARLKEASKELVETKARVSSFEITQQETRQELKGLKEQMALLTSKNNAAVNSLKAELGEANALIETLTEQLEEAQENKRGRSPSPSFFK